MRQERLGTSKRAGAKLDMGSTGTDPAGNLHVSHLNIEKMLEIIKLTGESTKKRDVVCFSIYLYQ